MTNMQVLSYAAILLPVVGPLFLVVAGYWAIRMGVRHGLLDAERRRSGPPPGRVIDEDPAAGA